jgi:hypothetical protein
LAENDDDDDDDEEEENNEKKRKEEEDKKKKKKGNVDFLESDEDEAEAVEGWGWGWVNKAKQQKRANSLKERHFARTEKKFIQDPDEGTHQISSRCSYLPPQRAHFLITSRQMGRSSRSS